MSSPSKPLLYPTLEDTPEYKAIMGYGESGFRQPSGQYVYSFSDFVQEVIKRSKTSEAELSVLRKGTQLWKVRSYDKWFPRRYTLDENHLRICYEPTHKPICSQTDNYIDILDIQDVRSGWATDTFNRVGRRVEERKKKYPTDPILQESHCFSIVYGDGQTLDLVAGEEDIAKKWVRGLRHLLSVVRGLRQERLYEEWLKAQFRKADKDNTGSLNFEECLKLLGLLNIKMSKDHVRKLFNEANTNRKTVKREQVLDEQEFLSFYQQLLKRPEVEELFRKYATSNGSVMTATELLTFFRKEYQDENVSIENVQKLIQSFELSEIKSRDCLSLAGFTNLLTSGMFEVLRPEHSTVHQDMTRPLAHYYIASSHNTYLTGNQLTSESSIEAYINALRKGCRCLELDLWDGPNDEPSIYHGHTITSAILVKDVLADAIKTHAFDVSPYPVILSLENHLSPPQQDKLAKHLKEILGDMLYTDPVDENLTSLPSPETLKYKIIIKGKKMKSASVMPSAPAADLAENEEESRNLSHLQASGRQQLDYALMRIDEPDGNVQAKPPAEEKLKKVVSKDLSDLVNICQAVSFKSFAQSRADNKWYQMSSFSEGRAKELMETAWDDFVEHTSRQLVRIYPAGSRTGSSNYNPVPYWKVGCQIVALNYQTPGKDMMVARARFLENGNCGYVLKPDFLFGASNQTNSMTITIRIISGQSLPKAREEKKKDVIDPYVSVKLYGESDDQKFKTKHVSDNGFNPVWNETTTFRVASPETTMILFQVKDKDKISNNEFIGGYALPVASLSQGYSHVPLLTKNGDAISPATIFIHVKFVKS